MIKKGLSGIQVKAYYNRMMLLFSMKNKYFQGFSLENVQFMSYLE
jgi:hypothetical protein